MVFSSLNRTDHNKIRTRWAVKRRSLHWQRFSAEQRHKPMFRQREILVDCELRKLIKRVLRIGYYAVRTFEQVTHPLCMAVRLSRSAVMRVGNWDKVVRKIDGPKLGPPQPIRQASRIKASMPDI